MSRTWYAFRVMLHQARRDPLWALGCIIFYPLRLGVHALKVFFFSALVTLVLLAARLRRIDSPLSAILCAPCTTRSRIASASVGSPSQACQAAGGNWAEAARWLGIDASTSASHFVQSLCTTEGHCGLAHTSSCRFAAR